MDTELNNYSFELSKIDSEIVPCNEPKILSDPEKYKKLELSASQKIQISALAANIPNIIAIKNLTNAYLVRFPKGLPHTLTALKQGGYGTMLKGSDGKFSASASMESLAKQSAILSGFTAMSIISGQYFLKQINQQLNSITNKVEKILDFLQKDKLANLHAKFEFAQYAFDNYSNIMANNSQRIATIVNLQQIKIDSNANILFYISYSDPKKTKESDFEEIYYNITTSLDLYILSNILEICYSQNIEEEFIKNITKHIERKIEYSQSKMNSFFSQQSKLKNEKWIKIKEELSSGSHLYFKEKKEFITSFIGNFNNMKEFYITTSGDVYSAK